MVSVLVAAGVSAAVGIGSSLLINALSPAQKIDSGGVSDLGVPKSSYGAVIPQCWGEVRTAGILLWASKKKEVTKTKRQGGKGSPKVETKERTYFQSFALLLAYCPHRPAEQLLQLHLNGKLVYDSLATDPDTISASNEFAARYMRFYAGDTAQLPDPLMESVEPIQSHDYGLPNDPSQRANALIALGLDPNLNHIPGYRKKVILVLENLPLADYGNQLPVVKANIRFNSNNSLETIVTDICSQVGISQIDTTGIQNIFVPGFYINSITEAKQALRTLQTAYFFDIIKSGNTLKFIAQTESRAVTNLNNSELSSRQGGQAAPSPFELPKPDPEDLPASVEVTFIDKENYQESGNVLSRSQVAGSKRKETFNFPIVMDSNQAQQIADNLLYQFYLEAIKPSRLSLSPKYLFLEVGDRVTVDFYGDPYTLQITKMAIGANRIIKIDTKVVEAANISTLLLPSPSVAPTGYAVPTETIVPPGNTNLRLLDINLISDTDDDYGIYFTANGGGNWREASLYGSNDNSNFSFLDTIETYGTIGTLANSLDANSTSILVDLESGEFDSISTIDLDNGINKLLVGNEILQFQNRTLNGIQEELSGLRRGLRGTETFINSHSIGERVILLTGNGAEVKRLPSTSNHIGQTRYFKAPSPGQTLADAVTFSLTIAGNDLKPYAPVNLKADVDIVGNITLSWTRRDRRAGDSTNYVNLPLSELEEKWETEILNGSNTIRTLESLETTISYSANAQIADFNSLQSSVSVNIYQISAVVGRGYPLSQTITPSFAEAVPIITEFYPTVASEGETITAIGSGLAGVTAVQIASVAGTNLAVTNDNELTFVVAPNSNTGKIELTAPGGSTTSESYLNILNIDLSGYMKKSDYLNSNGLIPQSIIAYPGVETKTLPYTIDSTNIGKELTFINATGTLTIPDLATGFVTGWGCIITLQGTGNIEVKRANGTTTGLIFSGGDTFNHLKNQGAIAISHRGSNIWLILGCLETP